MQVIILIAHLCINQFDRSIYVVGC